jgi:hypothetical protein
VVDADGRPLSPGDYDTLFNRVSVPTTQIQIAQGNPYRLYLGIMATGGTIFFGPTTKVSVAFTGPYTINSNTTLFEFFWDRHKAMVNLPWYAITAAAGNFLLVSELVIVPGR